MGRPAGVRSRLVTLRCVLCDDAFEAGRINAKYCPACRKARSGKVPSRERGAPWAQLDHLRVLRTGECPDCGKPCTKGGRCKSCASRDTALAMHAKRRAALEKRPLPVEKVCVGCGESKPLEDFHRSTLNWTGRHPRCKPCRAEYTREYRERNREVIADRNHRSRQFRRDLGADGLPEVMAAMRLHPCAYCGADDRSIHIDHIHPLSRGGVHEVTNLAPACAPCNLSKGSRLLFEEWQPPRGVFYFDLTILDSLGELTEVAA